MTPSAKIETFIKGYEALRLKAYMPTKSDKPTIGYGATGPDIKLGMVWTADQANARFREDLKRFSDGVARLLPGSPPTAQNEFDALVSLAFNIGLANFKTSSVLTNHRAGHKQTAAWAFSLWVKQRDKDTGQLVTLNGLVKRRAAEAKIYRGEA